MNSKTIAILLIVITGLITALLLEYGTPLKSVEKYFDVNPSKLNESIPFETLTFPVTKDGILNTDIGFLAKEVFSDKNTASFIFSDTKYPLDKNGQPAKLHPKTYQLYERCQAIINSDQELTKIYFHLIGEEIFGLNSRLTNISGSVDGWADKVGRDYLYNMADNSIQFLMEGIDETGAEILSDLIPKYSDFQSTTYASQISSIQQGLDDPAYKFNKKDTSLIVMTGCTYLDIKLGFLGTGTNFQTRVQGLSDIIKRRLGQEKSRKHEERRERLNKTLDALEKLQN